MAKKKTEGGCTEFVGVRLTPTERAKLADVSKRTGLTVSGTIKALIVAAEISPVVTWVPVLTGGGGK